MPKKIRELKSALLKAGCSYRIGGKTSHTLWTHPKLPTEMVNLSGKDGDDTKHYQERDVKRLLEKLLESNLESL